MVIRRRPPVASGLSFQIAMFDSPGGADDDHCRALPDALAFAAAGCDRLYDPARQGVAVRATSAGSRDGAGVTGFCDIKPHTEVAALDRDAVVKSSGRFPISLVSPAVGMSPTFISNVTGQRTDLDGRDVLLLLDQDAYRETLVRRSQVLAYLEAAVAQANRSLIPNPDGFGLRAGSALDLLEQVEDKSVQCVVTSTPYWGMRVYEESTSVAWADGEICPYGHEQTPEGFLRHTTEILLALRRTVSMDGSIWWNLMDTFNTRTQIRGSAVEALRAMEGHDHREWADHAFRRYSAGHSHLKDGEQCLIPARVAERASRIGLYVKTAITWAKRSSLPEPQHSRVSRNLEYILHLSRSRTPKFAREPYLRTKPEFGGRNNGWESEKLSDVWVLNTSLGGGGHGAQFPIALPGRCIALSTDSGDLVLDPFVGSGNSGVAALAHGCNFLGFDVSQSYLAAAKEKIGKALALKGLARSSAGEECS
jgi:DNA modification methylase